MTQFTEPGTAEQDSPACSAICRQHVLQERETHWASSTKVGGVKNCKKKKKREFQAIYIQAASPSSCSTTLCMALPVEREPWCKGQHWHCCHWLLLPVLCPDSNSPWEKQSRSISKNACRALLQRRLQMAPAKRDTLTGLPRCSHPRRCQGQLFPLGAQSYTTQAPLGCSTPMPGCSTWSMSRDSGVAQAAPPGSSVLWEGKVHLCHPGPMAAALGRDPEPGRPLFRSLTHVPCILFTYPTSLVQNKLKFC